jgi:molybdate transport system substrate-binding protein
MLKAVATFFLIIVTQFACADVATVAVASNFKSTLEKLDKEFRQQQPHQLRIVSAASGVLYSQALHGARFDLLLSADSERPRLVEEAGTGVPGSRFTYALGQLALTGPMVKHPSNASELLGNLDGKLAIANPELAPYGLAARQTLQHLGLWQALQDQLVMGANIGQAYQFVATGNAPMGLVALPLVLQDARKPFHHVIPAAWHEPILQQAILMKSGRENAAAIAFLEFLRSNPSRDIIAKDGYLLPGVR